jgi:hypothetical protein
MINQELRHQRQKEVNLSTRRVSLFCFSLRRVFVGRSLAEAEAEESTKQKKTKSFLPSSPIHCFVRFVSDRNFSLLFFSISPYVVSARPRPFFLIRKSHHAVLEASKLLKVFSIVRPASFYCDVVGIVLLAMFICGELFP